MTLYAFDSFATGQVLNTECHWIQSEKMLITYANFLLSKNQIHMNDGKVQIPHSFSIVSEQTGESKTFKLQTSINDIAEYKCIDNSIDLKFYVFYGEAEKEMFLQVSEDEKKVYEPEPER